MMRLSICLPEIPLTVTPEQFAAIAAENRDLRLERTANGELIVNPPTGSESGKFNFSILGQLFQWCEQHPDLGEGFDSSAGFELPNGAIRSPDAAWVRRDRWDALTQQQKEGFAPLCPDFVVELRSKTDRLPTLQEKMQEYINNGMRLGWLIDRQSKRVEIYRLEGEVQIIEKPEALTGEEILPGFVLLLKSIWK